jgi:hypothetical protein
MSTLIQPIRAGRRTTPPRRLLDPEGPQHSTYKPDRRTRSRRSPHTTCSRRRRRANRRAGLLEGRVDHLRPLSARRGSERPGLTVPEGRPGVRREPSSSASPVPSTGGPSPVVQSTSVAVRRRPRMRWAALIGGAIGANCRAARSRSVGTSRGMPSARRMS